jgi:hypothetical protein
VNFCVFYFYRIIGKLTVFLQFQEFSLSNMSVTSSTTVTRCSSPSSNQNEVVSLVKEETLRITLNLDGVVKVSQTHDHPSHSKTSRLLTSSLSLGVSVDPSVFITPTLIYKSSLLALVLSFHYKHQTT